MFRKDAWVSSHLCVIEVKRTAVLPRLEEREELTRTL
ncbi:Hypothetical protein, putative [Bodo saltans]|uniref:Uncharacterized protein n=1 Tax=Bodo saltans TaxID=75058 RepID=A0A0S4KJC3_BODSA|nr:Hypothetical protein, putative [Bodo saltans]|eukprot:CUI14635.1 Hypothetical protein, putative [Bodo saltans]